MLFNNTLHCLISISIYLVKFIEEHKWGLNQARPNTTKDRMGRVWMKWNNFGGTYVLSSVVWAL